MNSYPNSNLAQFDYTSFFKAKNLSNFCISDYMRNRELSMKWDLFKTKDKPHLSRKDSGISQEVLPRFHLEKESVHDNDITMIDSDMYYSKEPYCYRVKQHIHPSQLSLWSFKKSPQALKEYEIQMDGSDKIFASLWISDHQVAFGTKSNQLRVLNVLDDSMITIPNITLCSSDTGRQGVSHSSRTPLSTEYPSSQTSLHDAFVQSFSTMSHLSTILSSFPSSLDGATINPHVSPAFSPAPFHVHCSGIHSLCMNPSKTLLAVGAGKPNDSIQIYSLPSLEPFAVLLGHQDMVFGVVWVSDTRLMSASRDKKVLSWELVSDNVIRRLETVLVYKSVACFQDKGKVRDLQIDPLNGMVASLSSDGFVKLWDSQLFTVRDYIPLYHTNELVCMTADPEHHLFAVGSQSHITLIDPRTASAVHTVESLDEGWGVRSVLIQEGTLLVGGGMGRLSFYDLTNQKYQTWKSMESDSQMFHKTGKGWLQRDSVYDQHFRNMDINNAIYTLSYQPKNTMNLFLGGGPLQLSLKGSYAGFWKV